jgi:diacylglycerol kinase family enzyme
MDAFLVERCRIEPRTTRVSLDGELVSLTPPFDYRHLPAHLRVVVGRRQAAVR